jgi:hypothetical protein
MPRFILSKPILTEAIEYETLSVQNNSDENEDDESDPAVELMQNIPTDQSSTTVRRIRNEEEFWNYIEKMAWLDKSENPNFSVEQKKLNYRSLVISDQEAFAEYLTRYVNALDEKLQSVNFYGIVIDVNERKAICSHIVGKGSVFYAMTIEDPGFASYLIPENTDQKDYYDMMEFILI